MTIHRPGAVVMLLAASGAVAVLIAAGTSSSKPGKSRGTTGSATATVERGDLVATDTEAGTLSYAGAQTVYDRLSGTITWLPQVGETIKPGEALFRVDGRPVVLMDGASPAFRELVAGIA